MQEETKWDFSVIWVSVTNFLSLWTCPGLSFINMIKRWRFLDMIFETNPYLVGLGKTFRWKWKALRKVSSGNWCRTRIYHFPKPELKSAWHIIQAFFTYNICPAVTISQSQLLIKRSLSRNPCDNLFQYPASSPVGQRRCLEGVLYCHQKVAEIQGLA